MNSFKAVILHKSSRLMFLQRVIQSTIVFNLQDKYCRYSLKLDNQKVHRVVVAYDFPTFKYNSQKVLNLFTFKSYNSAYRQDVFPSNKFFVFVWQNEGALP